jgi:uncharacterized membrane protein YvbJ
MYCVNCGKRLNEGEEYCSVCGTPPDLRVCRRCGAKIDDFDTYCYNCGEKQDDADVEIKEAEKPLTEEERRRAGTLFCKKCGLKLPNEKSPCKCGAVKAKKAAIAGNADRSLTNTASAQIIRDTASKIRLLSGLISSRAAAKCLRQA